MRGWRASTACMGATSMMTTATPRRAISGASSGPTRAHGISMSTWRIGQDKPTSEGQQLWASELGFIRVWTKVKVRAR